MKLEKWLWSASGLRANLEGGLAALLLLASLISITRYLVNLPYLQGIVLIGALVPSVVGLRRRPVYGSRGQIVVFEVLQALGITAGLIGLNFCLAAVLGMEPEMQRLHQTVDLIVFLVSAGRLWLLAGISLGLVGLGDAAPQKLCLVADPCFSGADRCRGAGRW